MFECVLSVITEHHINRWISKHSLGHLTVCVHQLNGYYQVVDSEIFHLRSYKQWIAVVCVQLVRVKINDGLKLYCCDDVIYLW